MEKRIDMHTHTCYSDGELTPEELIKRAISKGITTIAITDHDTIKGIEKVNREESYIKDSGIEVINGIELSAKVPKGRMHILGYNIDLKNPKLLEKTKLLRDISLNSVLTIMEQIKREHGIYFSYDDIQEMINREHNLGRPDIAKLLVRYGYATTVKEAFQKYLIDAFEKTRQFRKGISYEECLDIINSSGGTAVLAHPKSLELGEKEFLQLLRKMITRGLKGIEVYHSSHSKEEMAYYKKIAQEYQLLESGGSDYHGPNVKPDIEIGSGKNGNIKIKQLSLLDEIHRK